MLIKEQARLDAEETLRAYWPMGRYPVDAARIAMDMGIRVYRASLDPKVSGLIMKRSGEDPVIYFEDTDTATRQNFTCAHELGHFVERSTRNVPDREFEFVDLREEGVNNPHEFYANEFAANLLMPANEVRRQHHRGGSKFDLAAFFGVSLPAMEVRLAKLKLHAR